MPTIHRIDTDLKTVFVEATGHIEIEELLQDEQMILDNPDFKKGFNKFIDFSGAKPGAGTDFENIRMSANFIAMTQYLRGKSKWSIYAPNQDAYNYSSIFSELTKELELETKVFKDEQEARSWLGI